MFPIFSRQFHKNVQIGIEIERDAVEIKDADGEATQIPADGGVHGLGDDAVHAREWTGIQHAIASGFVKGDGIPGVERHLTQCLFLGKVRPTQFEDPLDGVLMPVMECRFEWRGKRLFIVSLKPVS